LFVVTEAEADAIRAVYQQRGEFAAAIELRRRFPGITDNAQAQECARTIAGWKPVRPLLTGFLRRARGCMIRFRRRLNARREMRAAWQTKVRRRWCVDQRRQPAKV
jgi:hypothetical protein